MKIYVVATPIGNLKDITIRALKILREVDYIFAEDSRISRKLLNRYNINKKIITYHKFNEKKVLSDFFSSMGEDVKIALLSDAGTPLISDPGKSLIEFAFENNYEIIPVPGVSAITALLSITPFESNTFTFIGFLEKKTEKRKKQLKKFLEKNIPFIFFESPKRILETLEILKQLAPENKIFIGRELTKKFEEIIYGKIEDVLLQICKRDIKGEIVAITECREKKLSASEYSEDIKILHDLNLSTKDIATFISKKYNIKKNEIYNSIKKGIKR